MIETPLEYLRMVELYREWNDRINVVSRKDIDSLYHHHILHSLAIAEYLRRFYPVVAADSEACAALGIAGAGTDAVNKVAAATVGATPGNCAALGIIRGRGPAARLGGVERSETFIGVGPGRRCGRSGRILDVGTGGGFPGIPLATVFPEVEFTLCDSIGKKVRVAQAVAEGLGLANVTCINARAESLPGPFDWVVSRAVTSLENFYPWVRGKYNNSILYLKGGDVEAEIDALVRKFKLPRGNVRTWKISEWLENDEYFAEKFVIEIGKNYLCAPKSE